METTPTSIQYTVAYNVEFNSKCYASVILSVDENGKEDFEYVSENVKIKGGFGKKEKFNVVATLEEGKLYFIHKKSNCWHVVVRNGEVVFLSDKEVEEALEALKPKTAVEAVEEVKKEYTFDLEAKSSTNEYFYKIKNGSVYDSEAIAAEWYFISSFCKANPGKYSIKLNGVRTSISFEKGDIILNRDKNLYLSPRLCELMLDRLKEGYEVNFVTTFTKIEGYQ